jgi:hypothetical protein
MASVGGSQLSVFLHGNSEGNVNLVLTTDGSGDLPDPHKGKLDIEVFTVQPGTVEPGYDGAIFVPDATLVDKNTVTNVGQTSATEVLLSGSFKVVDETGNQSISIQGSAAGGDSMTVVGSAGDTITGSTIAGTSQLIDVSNKDKNSIDGSETVIGGAGATTVLAGFGDSIVGGAGDMLVIGGEHDTIVGGSGSITIQGGADDSIVPGSGGVISVEGHGGMGDGQGGGQGKGEADDSVGGGPATVASSNWTTGADQAAGEATIVGTGGTTFVDDSGQGASTVFGFDTQTDLVQSTTSVGAGDNFLGSSSTTAEGTTLTFVDGSTMFLVGVTDPALIKFTQS